MILKSLREKAIDKRIRRELQRESEERLASPGEISSLAIIIDYEKLADFRPLMKLASTLSVANEQVYIAGYVDKVHKSVNYLIPVFSESSVKTNGMVRSPQMQEFLSRKYDLLVSYYSDDNAILRLMTALTRASFKVGIAKDLSMFNDLTLLTGENDFEGFQTELVKYLTILSKQK